MSKRAAWVLSAAILVVGLLGVAPAARADTIPTGDCSGNTCTFGLYDTNYSSTEYVQVQVVLNSTGDATITFTSESSLGMVDSGAFDLSVNILSAGGWTGAYSNLSSGLTLNCDITNVTSGGCANIDNIGTFNFSASLGTSANPVSSLSVELTGGGWTSASEVLNTNNDLNLAGSHFKVNTTCTFFVGNASGSSTSGTGCTPTTTPEPATGGMLAMGLMAIGGVGLVWRRRREF